MSNLNGIVSGETKVNDDVHHLVAQDEGDELFARVMAQLKVHGKKDYSTQRTKSELFRTT